MTRQQYSFLMYLMIVLGLNACSSGKSAFEHGNYYEAVITSVNRLRKNDDHKKSSETLRQAYPMAVAFYEDRANASLASNAEFKWTAVVESYTTINVMYDEIRRSPGALRVIPNPVNYYAKLEEAKKNAAEENYVAGITAMTFGTREKAKLAYSLFNKTNAFVPGYKDVIKMTETALWNATVKVVMEPIPVQAKNISVSAEFFDDKVSEYLHSASLNEFVKFYTRKEAQTLNLNPDHIIRIEFDEFVVGQVFMNEREIALERDSVIAGMYVTQSGGSTSGGSTGGGNNSGGTGGNNSGGTSGGGTGGNSGGNISGGVSGGNAGGSTSGGNNSGGTTGGGNSGGSNSGNSNNSGGTSGGSTGGNNSGGTSGGTSGGNAGGNTSGGNNTGGTTGSGNSGGNSSGNSGGNNSGGGADSKDQDTTKVTVCHIPLGNEANRHTLVISKSALKAHLAHGDTEGTCEEIKDKKPKDNKKPSGKPQGLISKQPVFFASTNTDPWSWLAYTDSYEADTTKLYMTVKATYFYFKKTTTSKGVISFRIIDAKTNALLSVEKMPGEYVWISEWATFNGDERALTQEQLSLTKLKEQVPPPPQDLFIEFTRPIYDQVTTKIRDFYKGY